MSLYEKMANNAENEFKFKNIDKILLNEKIENFIGVDNFMISLSEPLRNKIYVLFEYDFYLTLVNFCTFRIELKHEPYESVRNYVLKSMVLASSSNKSKLQKLAYGHKEFYKNFEQKLMDEELGLDWGWGKSNQWGATITKPILDELEIELGNVTWSLHYKMHKTKPTLEIFAYFLIKTKLKK